MNILDPQALQAEILAQIEEKAVLKEIEFELRGELVKATVYIKSLSFEQTDEIEKSVTWKKSELDPNEYEVDKFDTKRMQAAQVLGTACIDADGNLMFETVDQVLKSNPKLVKAIWSASNDINNFGGKSRTKNSKEKKFGRNLSSVESEEEPSEMPSDESQTENSAFGENTSDVEEA